MHTIELFGHNRLRCKPAKLTQTQETDPVFRMYVEESMNQLIPALIEASVPLIGGALVTYSLFRRRRLGDKGGLRWVGPFVIVFGILTAIRPLVGAPESQSLLYQTAKRLTSRNTASLEYSDFIGTWTAVIQDESIRRRLTYTLTVKPDNDCALDYVSYNLDTTGETKHFYDMKCQVAEGQFSHAAKDPNNGEQYNEAHKILEFTDGAFLMDDQFLGQIRYKKT